MRITPQEWGCRQVPPGLDRDEVCRLVAPADAADCIALRADGKLFTRQLTAAEMLRLPFHPSSFILHPLP